MLAFGEVAGLRSEVLRSREEPGVADRAPSTGTEGSVPPSARGWIQAERDPAGENEGPSQSVLRLGPLFFCLGPRLLPVQVAAPLPLCRQPIREPGLHQT